jgi:RNA-directed DNA polymerase
MFGFLRSLFSKRVSLPPPRFTLDDLARRLEKGVPHLRGVRIDYHTFQIPKRSGGVRTIDAPADTLKAIQRRILHKVLHGLRAHPAATGFERGRSIVTNALAHAHREVVIRLDLVDFFPSIKTERVRHYFRFIGYDDEAADMLAHLCTHNGVLPQGAPTSPRLSNLVNYRLDARLAGLARCRGLTYTRYADDITFSADKADLAPHQASNPKTLAPVPCAWPRVNDVIHAAKRIIRDEGYRLHIHRKLRIYRRHQRQLVTGLVVNEKPNLPRATRRRLRAVAHHLQTGRPATLTADQLAGWHALQAMIAAQSTPVPPA